MPRQQRSQRLSLVLDLISREEETERIALGELQARARQAEIKVQELINYQRQYQNELKATGNKGPGARFIQNYHVFISRLGVAIEQQEQQLALLAQQLNQQRQKWQTVYYKKSNMKDYIARCRQAEQRADEKKQQRDLDDAVYRRTFRQSDH